MKVALFSLIFFVSFSAFAAPPDESDFPVVTDPPVNESAKKTEFDQYTDWLSTQSRIQIYKYDANIEGWNCNNPVELWDIQKQLSAEGVKVFSSEKGYDGLMYSLEKWACEELPIINIFWVAAENYKTVKKLGFRLCEELQDNGGECYPVYYSDRIRSDKNKFYVHIYKNANQLQCQLVSEIDIKTMEQELINSKIVVYQKYQAVDGLVHPLSCENNHINVYVIEKSGLAKSISMGYRECAWLEMQGGGCYPVTVEEEEKDQKEAKPAEKEAKPKAR